MGRENRPAGKRRDGLEKGDYIAIPEVPQTLHIALCVTTS